MLKRSGKFTTKLLPLLLAVCLLASILGSLGCSEDGDVLLTLVKGDQTKTYTLSQLKDMTAVTGTASFMKSTGDIIGEASYKGVALTDLADDVGSLGTGEAATITASDEYAMTMTYDQISLDAFTTFDASGAETDSSSRDLVVILAYEVDDEEIGDADGPLRLLIVADDGELISTEGHWWVKHVVEIEIKDAEVSWTLELVGGTNGMDEDMTNNTFEAGAASGCHGVTYTDDDGNEWEGIPLWRIIGRIDDNDAHTANAFNTTKAAAGYDVKIIASDDYSKTIAIGDVPTSDDPDTTWLLAYKLNGEVLPETDDDGDPFAPLKLVGSTTTGKQRVASIVKIELVDLPA